MEMKVSLQPTLLVVAVHDQGVARGVLPRTDSGTSVAPVTRSHSKDSALFLGTIPPSPMFLNDCQFSVASNSVCFWVWVLGMENCIP